MKKLIILFFIVLSPCSTLFSQSNSEISGVYLSKAEKNYKNLEIDQALINFNKAIALKDTINDANTARLGVLIYYELQEYEKAFNYAKRYFILEKNKRSDDYQQQLELFVNIKDELDKLKALTVLKETERLQKEKALKRLDSLKLFWKQQALSMAIKADTIYTFNKYNSALYKTAGNFGIVNDVGIELVKADEYKAAHSFDGYFILMNTEINPTKIFCYNANTKQGFKLPEITEFNQLSTHYGKVMLPRGNHKLVTYPNNTLKVLVYDLVDRKFIADGERKDLFKSLEKNKFIDNSNKDGDVKIDKIWYRFGGQIGGGISPLFNTDYTLFGYICALDGSKLLFKDYNYIGSFYNEKLQVTLNDDIFWINQNGTKVPPPIDENGVYAGTSKVEKADAGFCIVYQNIDGKSTIVSGAKRLLNLDDFLKSYQNQEY